MDRMGIWHRIASTSRAGKCLQTEGACDNNIRFDDCDEANGSHIWGYVGGKFYNFACFHSEQNGKSILEVESRGCGANKDPLDLVSLGGEEGHGAKDQEVCAAWPTLLAL
jgi:hypothetical protein